MVFVYFNHPKIRCQRADLNWNYVNPFIIDFIITWHAEKYEKQGNKANTTLTALLYLFQYNSFHFRFNVTTAARLELRTPAPNTSSLRYEVPLVVTTATLVGSEIVTWLLKVITYTEEIVRFNNHFNYNNVHELSALPAESSSTLL